MLCLEEEMEGRGFQDKAANWVGAAPPLRTATVDSDFIRKRNRAERPRAIGGGNLLRKRITMEGPPRKGLRPFSRFMQWKGSRRRLPRFRRAFGGVML